MSPLSTNITPKYDNFLSRYLDLLHSVQNSSLLLFVETAEDEVVSDRHLDSLELLSRLRLNVRWLVVVAIDSDALCAYAYAARENVELEGCKKSPGLNVREERSCVMLDGVKLLRWIGETSMGSTRKVGRGRGCVRVRGGRYLAR